MHKHLPARWSRILWFICGVVAAFVLLVGLSVIVAAVAWGSTQPKPAEVARVVARPLVPVGTSESVVSEPEMYAALSSRLAEAARLGQGSGELATVAREYGEALNSLKAILAETPSAQPLVRAGLETWKGTVDKNDGGFWLGILGVGSELSKIREFSARVSTIHSRIVACRLRVAEIAVKHAQPESAADTATATFYESGGLSSVANDTLEIRNVSGQRLTNVMVVTELTGRSGERFSNLFFADAWEPNQVLIAISKSESPGRETVHNVTQVRFRIMADQRTSHLAELRVNK